MMVPSIPMIMRDFNVSGKLPLAALLVSVYVLGLGAGPLLMTPLSKLFGRLRVNHVTNIGVVGFTMLCSFAPSPALLLLCRAVVGIFGSCALANGPGVITDLLPAGRRKIPHNIYHIFRVAGFAVGPIVGAHLPHDAPWAWRGIFRLHAYAVGAVALAMMVCCRETYAPVLFQRWLDRVRVEGGCSRNRPGFHSRRSAADVFLDSLVGPFSVFYSSRECRAYAVLTGTLYGLQYIMLTTMDFVFFNHFGVVLPKGWYYLGFGIGCLFGLPIDWFAPPEEDTGHHWRALVPRLAGGTFLIFANLLIYGWMTESHTDRMAAFVFFCLIFLGMGITWTMGFVRRALVAAHCYEAPLVDEGPAALAVAVLFKGFMGTMFPIFGLSMYARLGPGWASTLLAVIMATVSSAALVATM